jgi:hypothetical protein
VYKDADFLSVWKQKRRIIGVALGVTVLYFLYCLAWLFYHISLPYGHSGSTFAQIMAGAGSVLYACFIFPFLAIKGSRCFRYYKMLRYVSEGMKNEEKNYFFGFEKKALQKDNIDVMGCVFETWSKKKSEWMDREAYWDVENPLPPFESGDYVQYIVQSNFIVQYNVLQKKALEFEIVEDDEEETTEEEYVPEDALENGDLEEA